jgi:hypothetical protein
MCRRACRRSSGYLNVNKRQRGRSAPAPVLAADMFLRFKALKVELKSSHFLQASKTVFAIKQIEDSPHD